MDPLHHLQVRREPLTGQTDLFSVGVLLFGFDASQRGSNVATMPLPLETVTPGTSSGTSSGTTSSGSGNGNSSGANNAETYTWSSGTDAPDVIVDARIGLGTITIDQGQ